MRPPRSSRSRVQCGMLQLTADSPATWGPVNQYEADPATHQPSIALRGPHKRHSVTPGLSRRGCAHSPRSPRNIPQTYFLLPWLSVDFLFSTADGRFAKLFWAKYTSYIGLVFFVNSAIVGELCTSSAKDGQAERERDRDNRHHRIQEGQSCSTCVKAQGDPLGGWRMMVRHDSRRLGRIYALVLGLGQAATSAGSAADRAVLSAVTPDTLGLGEDVKIRWDYDNGSGGERKETLVTACCSRTAFNWKLKYGRTKIFFM